MNRNGAPRSLSSLAAMMLRLCPRRKAHDEHASAIADQSHHQLSAGIASKFCIVRLEYAAVLIPLNVFWLKGLLRLDQHAATDGSY